MDSPQSLSYDVNTHRLWVGSLWDNKVCVYRYITRQDALTDEHRPRPDGDTRYTTPRHNKSHQLNENEHRPPPDGDAMSSSTPAV
uniref:Uncharacterized protein n=1 Tax=Magallana gigas TaxID=29159 RepID=A0A8W8NXR4_MAGGI